jgi:hypothetical protein
MKTNYKNFDENFENIFKNVFYDVYVENIKSYSDFYQNFYKGGYKSHPLFSQIISTRMIFKDKFLLQKLKNTDLIKNMDNAISIFLFGYWSFNGNDENYTNLKISFLFREFLNFIGWDHLKHLATYKIVEDFQNPTDDYTKKMLAENLPELLDDFIGVFIKPDAPSLGEENLSLKNYITEFCNMLYNEGFINYMVEPIK